MDCSSEELEEEDGSGSEEESGSDEGSCADEEDAGKSGVGSVGLVLQPANTNSRQSKTRADFFISEGPFRLFSV